MNPRNTYFGQTGPGQSRGRSKRSLVLIVLIVMVVVTVIVALGSTLVKPGQERLANSFIAKVAAGDAEGSFEMLSADAKQTTSVELWTKYVNNNKPFFTGKTEMVYDQRLEGTEGTEFGINVGETGKIYRVTIVVVSEKDASERIYSVRTTPTTL